MKEFLQILGVALVVLGGQGAVRIAIHHDDVGLFGWLSHNFAVVLAANLVLVIVGAIVATLASKKES